MVGNWRKGPYFVAFFAVLGIFFVYLYRGPIYSAAYDFNLIPKPEPVTELYMNDYPKLLDSLPTSIQPGTKIAFSFGIHNLEGKSMKYPYQVSVIADGRAAVIDSGTMELANTASTTLHEIYIFKSAYSQATVIISLPQQNQSLHFFVPALK